MTDEQSYNILNFGNKTVASLIIHNKEVASIVTSDDVVLYQKNNDIEPVVAPSISLSTSKSILSFYNPNVFSDWTGSYTTGVDTYNYITPSSDNLTINKTLPSEFIFKYKFYTNGNDNSGCLWTIGINANNGVLVGHELTSQRMRLYTRSNGLNTSRYTTNNAYSNNVWTNVTVTYQNQTISISMNGYTQSYALSEASYLKIYYNYNAVRLADLEIIDLSNNNVISSTSNNAILTATVTDENNNACSNQTVTFKSDNTILGTAITDNNGVATYTYNSQGVGDVYASAETNNLSSNSILIEDWIYKDFTDYGGWSAFSGRNTSSMSISDNTLSITSGNKGGAHSVNTIFNLPNDDYEVSFKITETTKVASNGVRIGIHSANYSDHHEKACCGIAYVGESSNNKISFDVSDNDVTAVTKTTIGDNLAVGDIIRFRVEGTTLKCYYNDSLYVTETLAWLHDPIWLYCQSWGSGASSMSITDFRVRRIINN